MNTTLNQKPLPSSNADNVVSVGTTLQFLDRIYTAYKTADESVSASSTLQNDNELFFPIAANAIFEFEFLLFVTIASGTPDFKAALNCPVGTVNLRAHLEGKSSPTDAGGIITTPGTPQSVDWPGTVDSVVVLRGTIENGATAGNVTLQWAQDTSDATATVVKRGSFLRAVRLS